MNYMEEYVKQQVELGNAYKEWAYAMPHDYDEKLKSLDKMIKALQGVKSCTLYFKNKAVPSGTA